MDEILSGLNENQQRAVRTTDGPLLIIAGAGTGKTRTLICRLAYLITRAGIPPEKLLAITFTAKAAEEIRDRIRPLCAATIGLASVWIGTIHALCHEILQTHGEQIGIRKDFAIITPAERTALIKQLLRESAAGGIAAQTPKQCELLITREKNAAVSYDGLSPFTRTYQQHLESQGVLDFDDLILKTIQLCNTVPATAILLRKRFSHISVDEYQDINVAQYRLIRSLCPSPPNLCVVGDADQAIYAFRGAQVGNFLNFQKDFPGAAVVALEEHYRSTSTILSAACRVIKNNQQRIDTKLLPVRPEGPAIELCDTPTDQDEAAYIAKEIERLLGGTRFETLQHEDGDTLPGFGDIAVLYRLHHQSNLLKKELQNRGIPVTVAKSRSFYEEPVISPVMQCLEIIVNPDDCCVLTAMLSDGPFAVGEKTLQAFIAQTQKSSAAPRHTLLLESATIPGVSSAGVRQLTRPGSLLAGISHESISIALDGLIKMLWANIYPEGAGNNDLLLELLTAAMPFSHVPAAQGIPLFLKKIALLKEGDSLTPNREAVTLMTVHMAKGLEFPVVFMPGLEQGLFPYITENSPDALQSMEEERRLFYVGMTRAKDRLYLLHAHSRFLFGRRKNMEPSSFLRELPQELIKKSMKTPVRKKNRQMKLFA